MITTGHCPFHMCVMGIYTTHLNVLFFLIAFTLYVWIDYGREKEESEKSEQEFVHEVTIENDKCRQ